VDAAGLLFSQQLHLRCICIDQMMRTWKSERHPERSWATKDLPCHSYTAKCLLTSGDCRQEREERLKAQAERNAKLLREREERQRKLSARDRDILDQRQTSVSRFSHLHKRSSNKYCDEEKPEENCHKQPQDMNPKGKQYVMEEGNYGDKASGLFGWANNNPSSKSVCFFASKTTSSLANIFPLPGLYFRPHKQRLH
jgi:hypothetical protein